ncbi:MAG TPA: flagellar export chaperone FliS [Bryobacteraceae bacterium]|jgi:flagellar protein FliS
MTNYLMARDEYLESEVFAAGPVRRVQLLYVGAIEAVAKARVLLAAKDIRGRSAQVNKSIAILSELIFSLDHTAGFLMTKELRELYDYCQKRLLTANATQTDEPLGEVEALLRTLLEAWNRVPEVETSTAGSPGSYMSADYGAGDSFGIRGINSGLDQLG